MVRYMSIEGIVSGTAIRRNERHYLAIAGEVMQQHPEFQEAILIGSVACKLLSDRTHTGRVVEATDLDFYFSRGIPERLKKETLERHPLIARSLRVYSTVRDINIHEENPNGEVYKFREGPFVDVVDALESPIETLVITPAQARYTEVDLGEQYLGTPLRVATPGFLLATQVKPESFTDRRVSRVQALVNSLDRATYQQAVEDCVAIFRANGITQDDFAVAMKKVPGSKRGRETQYRTFMHEVYNAL